MSARPTAFPGMARQVLATLFALIGSIVWTHALAGLLRAAFDVGVEELATAATALTLGAVATSVVAGFGFASARRATGLALVTGSISSGAIGVLHPAALLPGLALIPVGVLFAGAGAWLARAIPGNWEEQARRRPRWTAAWLLIALVATVQVGRLATYVTDAETDWFLSTRHPFYAKHECANAYVYGAELNRNSEPNIYDPAHYPGLNPGASPVTEIRGMTPEDPFQYAPQFLIWPRLAIGLTDDYSAMRSVWFGINVTLSIGAVLLLALWVGGRTGTIAGLLSPALLASFPVLHNFQYGQFHFASIALAILAMLAFRRGRSAVGGSLLAVSILSKLFPGLLLLVLAAQRRWRDLAWTAGAGAALTAVALVTVGPTPFAAFLEFHLPRLADGSAFAFGEAWPEVASLLTAGNQGVYGIVQKLAAMGLPGFDGSTAAAAGRVFALSLLALSVLLGIRTSAATRAEHAIVWLGLLGLGSLASAGAWADYVPLTCVWLLSFLAPRLAARPVAVTALGVCAVMQVFLLGAVPLGEWTGAGWMIPLSLGGALAMLFTFVSALLPVFQPALRAAPAALSATAGGVTRN